MYNFYARFYGLCLAEYGEETVCRKDRIPGESKVSFFSFIWKQFSRVRQRRYILLLLYFLGLTSFHFILISQKRFWIGFHRIQKIQIWIQVWNTFPLNVHQYSFPPNKDKDAFPPRPHHRVPGIHRRLQCNVSSQAAQVIFFNWIFWRKKTCFF